MTCDDLYHRFAQCFIRSYLPPRRILIHEYSGALERRGQRRRSAERSADPAIRAAMASRAGVASVQCRALRPYTIVPLLEHRVSQQTAGVHPVEPDPAVGCELRRLRQTERRAQRHAIRLRGVREGR